MCARERELDAKRRRHCVYRHFVVLCFGTSCDDAQQRIITGQGTGMLICTVDNKHSASHHLHGHCLSCKLKIKNLYTIDNAHKVIVQPVASLDSNVDVETSYCNISAPNPCALS